MATQYVYDANYYPWSTIVKILSDFSDGVSVTGTGVIVGKNDVLTASHVVFDEAHGGAATTVKVTPALDNTISPFGEYYGSLIEYSKWDFDFDGLLTPFESSHDIAMIGFNEPIGERTGWMGLDSSFTSGTVSVTGYPGIYGGNNMVYDVGSSFFDTLSNTILTYNLDINPGNSGGPLWNYNFESPSVYGIVSSSSNAASVKFQFNNIIKWLNGNDYLINESNFEQSNQFIYRFYNITTNTHFYTASADERDYISSYLYNFRYEGIAFKSAEKNINYTIDVFRFYNQTTTTHFYTANHEEAASIKSNLSSFIFEGAVFQAFASANADNIPLHRFYNTATGTHFYTADDSEYLYVLNNLPGLNYEGVACYVSDFI